MFEVFQLTAWFRIYVPSQEHVFPVTGLKVTVVSDDSTKEHEREGTCLFILTRLSLKTQTGFYHIFLSAHFTAHRFAGLEGKTSSLAQSITIALDVLSTMDKRQIHYSNFSENSANSECYMYR